MEAWERRMLTKHFLEDLRSSFNSVYTVFSFAIVGCYILVLHVS
jgi:hypothetical protein